MGWSEKNTQPNKNKDPLGLSTWERWAGDLMRNSLSLEAPAMQHKAHSSPTVWRSKLTLGVAPSNTHEFRCFHTSQDTKMMNEFSPLSISLGAPLIAFFHQLEMWTFVVKGATTSKFSRCRIKNHTCRVKTHEMSNCWIVSPIQSKIIDTFDFLWFPSCKFNHYFIGKYSCNIYGSAFKTNLHLIFFCFQTKFCESYWWSKIKLD